MFPRLRERRRQLAGSLSGGAGCDGARRLLVLVLWLGLHIPADLQRALAAAAGALGAAVTALVLSAAVAAAQP